MARMVHRNVRNASNAMPILIGLVFHGAFLFASTTAATSRVKRKKQAANMIIVAVAMTQPSQ
jgi:hypothetical protein